MRTLLSATALLLLAPVAAAQQSFLWEARSDAGTAYLLGSIHLMRPDAYPLSNAIEQAYAASDVVAFEIDLDEMQAGAMEMMRRGLYTDGSTLCDHVADSTCALVNARSEAAGMAGPVLERAEPWLASMLLTTTALQQAGYRSDLGLDVHFHTRAKADEKPRRGLETIADQIDFLDGMPLEEQEQFLHYTLREIETAVAQVDTMAALWKRGDADALAALAFGDLDEMPAFRHRMLTARNAAWLPQIEALVAEGHTPIVVVGALHLLGDDGLIALLESRGFTVTQQ